MSGGSIGWSVVPNTEGLRVQFPVRAHAGSPVRSPVGERVRGNQSMPLSPSNISLSVSLPLPPLSLRSMSVHGFKKKVEKGFQKLQLHLVYREGLTGCDEHQLVTVAGPTVLLSC